MSKETDFEAAQSEEITPGPWQLSVSASGWHISRSGYLIATVEKESDAKLIAAAIDLLAVSKCALADLEGIMPEFEPSGDKEHPGWQTIKELQAAIDKATK